MPKPNPWPDQNLYIILNDLNRHIERITIVGLVDGIKADNYSLISLLLPRLEKYTKMANKSTKLMMADYHLTGRPPKWYKVASGINLVYQEILDEIQRMRGYRNGHRWKQIQFSLESIREATTEIERRIKSVPEPIPDIIEELAQVAAGAWES